MPSVRNDTTPTEEGGGTIARLMAAQTSTAGALGNAMPKQHDAQVEQVCVWCALPQCRSLSLRASIVSCPTCMCRVDAPCSA